MYLTDEELEVAKKALATYKHQLFMVPNRQKEIDIINDILTKMEED